MWIGILRLDHFFLIALSCGRRTVVARDTWAEEKEGTVWVRKGGAGARGRGAGAHLEDEVLLAVSGGCREEYEFVVQPEHDQREHRVRQADAGGDHVLAEQERRDAARETDHDLDGRVGPAARHGQADADLLGDAVDRHVA